MILNGSQRGGALKLAAHLSNDIENDHVEIHELRGFSSETLRGAFQEADAIAKGTRCKQFLFSLSLSPPETERVGVADFEAAIQRAEKRLGLTDQPRAIVFDEKNGRRHAHVVWSRIDVREMKAVNLPFYKTRLTELSKDLFLEQNWRLPEGLRDKQNRNPTNFDLAEWQQAKRTGKDARAIKRVFQEAWQVSDNGAAFEQALAEKGYVLARGDRRGYVALDVEGQVYAVPKWAGVKTREVREKLGSPKQFPSVAKAKAQIAVSMQSTLSKWEEELARKQKALAEQQAAALETLRDQQRAAREKLKATQEARRKDAARVRQARFRSGLKGIWDRLRGEHRRIRRENEEAARQAYLRDQTQIDALVFEQIENRRQLKRQSEIDHRDLKTQQDDLARDRTAFEAMRERGRDDTRENPVPLR